MRKQELDRLLELAVARALHVTLPRLRPRPRHRSVSQVKALRHAA